MARLMVRFVRAQGQRAAKNVILIPSLISKFVDTIRSTVFLTRRTSESESFTFVL
jgi:hypothetical protein